MYARLRFDGTTTPVQAVRDITRCITSSNGAGGANSASYEFAEVVEIVDTVASGWSLSASTPLQSGATSELDYRYVLQSPHEQTGLFKYAAIKTNGARTGTTFNTWTTGSVVMSTVLDHNEATENDLPGYVGVNTTYATQHWLEGDYHIFAFPKFLYISASKAKDANNTVLSGLFSFICEVPPTLATARLNKAPVMMINGKHGETAYNTGNVTITSWESNNASTPVSYYRNEGFWCNFFNTFYNTTPGGEQLFRVVSFHMNTSGTVDPDDFFAGNTHEMYVENGTATGSNDKSSDTQLFSPNCNAVGTFHPQEVCAHVCEALSNVHFGKQRNVDGNKVLPLVPLRIHHGNWDNNTSFLSNDQAPIYMTYGGLAGYGDIFQYESTNYFYVPCFSGSSPQAAYLIKKA